MNKALLAGLMLSIVTMAHGSSLVEQAGKKLLPSMGDKKIFTTVTDEWQEQLAHAKKELAHLDKTESEFASNLKKNIESVKEQVAAIEAALKNAPDDLVSKKRLELNVAHLNDLNELPTLREEKRTNLAERIRILTDYLADPHFDKETLSDKDSYTIEDALTLNQLIQEDARKLVALAEQETNTIAEIENRRRASIAAYEEYKKSKDGKAMVEADEVGLNVKQKAILDNLRELLYVDRKKLEEMRIAELEHKLSIIRIKTTITQRHLEMIKDTLRRIRPLMTVSEADVALAKDDLDKKKHQVLNAKAEMRQRIDEISTGLQAANKELDSLSKRYNIPIAIELDEWNRELPVNGAAALAFLQVGALNDYALLLKRSKESIEAQSALEDERLRTATITIAVKEAFYKILSHKLITQENINHEIKRYETTRAENKANAALYKERLNGVAAQQAIQKRAAENIPVLRTALDRQKDTLFKGNDKEYAAAHDLLNHASARIEQQLSILNQMTTSYNSAINIIADTVKELDFIINELHAITIWYRPEHAISWIGVQNMGPDMQAFIRDIKAYATQTPIHEMVNRLQAAFASHWHSVLFALKILALFALLAMLRVAIPLVSQRVLNMQPVPSMLRSLTFLLLTFLQFLARHMISLTIWGSLFILLLFYPVTDPYLYVLFYLLSIPYLLYMANRWMHYLIAQNAAWGYIFLNREFQHRFFNVFSTLLYATIVIFFLREAFILGNYRKSELPTILLAVNFIIVQISVILLLTKEQILSLIPTRTTLWEWIYEQVDSFFYLILAVVIAVIVMSNPYVGFGFLVLYVLKKLFFTIIIIQLLFWFHELLKRATSHIFFYSDEEVFKERFAYGKTLYGLTAIAIFISFTFIGIIAVAKIWGWPPQLISINTGADIMGLLKTPLVLQDTNSPISVYTLLRILMFILAGGLASAVINRFILGRVFDILLIDAGVQNTTSSLTRYFVVITAVILGFQSTGLGELVRYLLGALILGIGWIIKDPMGDFIAYFILLVQRPIKVGDYVWIDDNTMGLVRKITPRSVVLRRKNSTTIVVPNTQVMNRVVVNWNYVRGFIAFDDILVTVAYYHEPEKVKDILVKVLDESPYVLKNPKPIVRLEAFSEFGYIFLVRGFLSSNFTLDQWDIASDIRFAIVKKLRDAGIALAYPVRIIVKDQNRTASHDMLTPGE